MLFAEVTLKFEPVIVTVAPTSALVGEKEVIVGTCPKTEWAKKKIPKNSAEPRALLC
jgi:hypothetical protein